MANRKSCTGFPSSHQRRFYATANVLKMGINYLHLSSFDNFDNTGRKVCSKSSLYKNRQRQSCRAINCLSTSINILAGGRPFPHEILVENDPFSLPLPFSLFHHPCLPSPSLPTSFRTSPSIPLFLFPAVDSIRVFAHAAGFTAAWRCLRFLVKMFRLAMLV